MLFRANKKRGVSKTNIYNSTLGNQIPKEQENLHNGLKSNAEAGNNIDEFLIHISKHVGETVSIFVKSGGMSGSGFTGILLSACKHYIVLITRPGLAPACSLGNSCLFICKYFSNSMHYHGHPYYYNIPGSITVIPFDKIACFVHNLTH